MWGRDLPRGRELRKGSIGSWLHFGEGGEVWGSSTWDCPPSPAPTAERARRVPLRPGRLAARRASVSSQGCLPLLPAQTYPLPNWEPAVLRNYLTEPQRDRPSFQFEEKLAPLVNPVLPPPLRGRGVSFHSPDVFMGEILVALTFKPCTCFCLFVDNW